MGHLKDSIGVLIEDQYARGIDGQKIARRLVEAGLRMMHEEGDLGYEHRIRLDEANGHATGEFHITTFRPTTGPEENVADYDATPRPLLDLAMALGQDIHHGDVLLIVAREDGFSVADGSVVREAFQMFDGYAQLHLAKSPPDIDKADRNCRMASKLANALGLTYTAPNLPETEASTALIEHDPLPGTNERPRRLSTDPLDRAEILAWFDMKLDGCTRNGMHDTYTVLRAMRDEVAQHLEAAPIDFATALRAFYEDVHNRNVKAGWWSDLASGKPKKRSVGELFMLFVTELWEAYDAYCSGGADDKLPHLPGLGVELGDLQIRFADFCGALQAGKIVSYSGVRNAGDEMFREIGQIADQYERIRKTPAANGDPENGDELAPQDVASMIFEKLEFNATRADHKPENRMKEGGKQT